MSIWRVSDSDTALFPAGDSVCLPAGCGRRQLLWLRRLRLQVRIRRPILSSTSLRQLQPTLWLQQTLSWTLPRIRLQQALRIQPTLSHLRIRSMITNIPPWGGDSRSRYPGFQRCSLWEWHSISTNMCAVLNHESQWTPKLYLTCILITYLIYFTTCT